MFTYLTDSIITLHTNLCGAHIAADCTIIYNQKLAPSLLMNRHTSRRNEGVKEDVCFWNAKRRRYQYDCQVTSSLITGNNLESERICSKNCSHLLIHPCPNRRTLIWCKAIFFLDMSPNAKQFNFIKFWGHFNKQQACSPKQTGFKWSTNILRWRRWCVAVREEQVLIKCHKI